MERYRDRAIKDAIDRSESVSLLMKIFPGLPGVGAAADLIVPFFDTRGIAHKKGEKSITFTSASREYGRRNMSIYFKDDFVRLDYYLKYLFSDIPAYYARWESKDKNRLALRAISMDDFAFIFYKDKRKWHFDTVVGEGNEVKGFTLNKSGLEKGERRKVLDLTRHSRFKVYDLKINGPRVEVTHKDFYRSFFKVRTVLPLSFPKPNLEQI